METMIGKVSHYYPKIGVAAVILEDHLAKGDRIHITGPHDDLHQSVMSMEIEHVPVTEADQGQDIGIKVTDRVHKGDAVFRESGS
jgi:putative protease